MPRCSGWNLQQTLISQFMPEQRGVVSNNQRYGARAARSGLLEKSRLEQLPYLIIGKVSILARKIVTWRYLLFQRN
jgi:hypothetical protein